MKKAALSPDLEVARRARTLREKLDPLVSDFHLLEIRLGEKPEILARIRGKGSEGRASWPPVRVYRGRRGRRALG